MDGEIFNLAATSFWERLYWVLNFFNFSGKSFIILCFPPTLIVKYEITHREDLGNTYRIVLCVYE